MFRVPLFKVYRHVCRNPKRRKRKEFLKYYFFYVFVILPISTSLKKLEQEKRRDETKLLSKFQIRGKNLWLCPASTYPTSTSVTRWFDYFSIFATLKIRPILSQICQNRLSILPSKKPAKICQRLGNFCKSISPNLVTLLRLPTYLPI